VPSHRADTPPLKRVRAPQGRRAGRRATRRAGGSSLNVPQLGIAGALGLAYGSFSYTKDTHSTKMGPFEMTVKDKETVNIPLWVGVGAVVAGGLMLVVPGRKS